MFVNGLGDRSLIPGLVIPNIKNSVAFVKGAFGLPSTTLNQLK